MFKIPTYEVDDCQIIKEVDTQSLTNSLNVFIEKMNVDKKQIGLRYAFDYEGIGHLLNKANNPNGYTDPDFQRWIEGTELLQKVASDVGIAYRGRVRLLLLLPNTCYSMHSDPDLYRTHIPLITNEHSFMVIDGVTWHLPLGYAYLVKVGKPHTAINAGSTNRIHIVSCGAPVQYNVNYK